MPKSSPDPAPSPLPHAEPWAFLRGGVILLGFLALGEALAPLWACVRVPVPGSVVGLLLLWGALQTKLIKAVQISGAARALLAVLPLLLVPAGVGVFVDGTLSGAKGLWYGAAVIALTAGGLAVVGIATQARLERGK